MLRRRADRSFPQLRRPLRHRPCQHVGMTRRIPLLAVAIGLTLAACGTSDPSATTTPDVTAPASTEAAPVTDSPAETAVADPEPSQTESPVEPPTTEPSTTQPAAETPVSETPVTEPPPAEPEPAPVGGRALATSVELDAQFDDNPFPDLVVDDIGRASEANIANILPSERPVLLWTWAPH